ncbi:hypothetical protein [Spiroplasma diminutum]|uniref:Uncharacterized protein n=1 Tax=Spiroplasma diminutum CUAS-1 TaxID=1276221 RepID=S5MK50_9MOLU|nr:hypothetical protein [Spiroplasma diminutum]AGR42345.1 hypothetical protein SDIMI_v3c06410 [Spiroplasma diminutum CUAS-1]
MLIEQIVKRFKKKMIESTLEDFKFRWEFEDFFRVLNIDNFFTMMEKQLNIKFNFNQEQDIKEKVLKIREWIEFNINDIKEIELQLNEMNKLDNLIHMIYIETKKIINNGLIVYLFYEKIHMSIEYNGNLYDTEDFFNLKLAKYKEELEKHLFVFLRSLNKNNIKENYSL